MIFFPHIKLRLPAWWAKTWWYSIMGRKHPAKQMWIQYFSCESGRIFQKLSKTSGSEIVRHANAAAHRRMLKRQLTLKSVQLHLWGIWNLIRAPLNACPAFSDRDTTTVAELPASNVRENVTYIYSTKAKLLMGGTQSGGGAWHVVRLCVCSNDMFAVLWEWKEELLTKGVRSANRKSKKCQLYLMRTHKWVVALLWDFPLL